MLRKNYSSGTMLLGVLISLKFEVWTRFTHRPVTHLSPSSAVAFEKESNLLLDCVCVRPLKKTSSRFQPWDISLSSGRWRKRHVVFNCGTFLCLVSTLYRIGCKCNQINVWVVLKYHIIILIINERIAC